MSLRKRGLLVVSVVLPALLCFAIAASHYVVNKGLGEIEQRQARETLTRIDVAVSHELSEIGKTTRDYAAWDRTYSFVQGRNPSYPGSELDYDTFHNLDLQVIAIFNDDIEPIFVRSFRNPEDASLSDGDRYEITRAVRSLAKTDSITSPATGIVRLGTGPALIAVHPVLPSDLQGAPRGYMLMAKDLDSDAIDTISQIVQLRLTLRSEPVSPAQFENLSPTSLKFTVPIHDLWGHQVAVFHAEMPRPLHREAVRARRWLIGSVVVTVLVLAFIAAVVGERLVLRPLNRMARTMENIRQHVDLRPRVPCVGPAEFRLLARIFNGMMDKLEDSQAAVMGLCAELQKQVELDSLTGLLNRRGITARLVLELERASRERTELAVITADIDHFKKINDTYGHLRGDEVLQEIARALARSVRSYDYVGRVGGEEFFVVAPSCGPEEAQGIAERIRREVSWLVWSFDPGRVVTISLGTASGSGPSQFENLLAEADAALYRAKELGRNRVECAPTVAPVIPAERPFAGPTPPLNASPL